MLPACRFRPAPVTAGRLVAVLATLGCLFASLAVWAGEARASTMHYTYRFDPAKLEISGPAAGAVLRAAELPHTWEEGQPELPYDVVTLLVPRGSRLRGVHALGGPEVVFADRVRLEPAAPISNDAGKILRPKPARLASAAGAAEGPGIYPAILAAPAGGGALHGYQLVSVRVYPVRYDPATGRVLVSRTLDLDLDLEPGGALPLERQRYSPAIEAAARRQLQGLVANPGNVDGYVRRIGVLVEKAPGGFKPTVAPSLEGSPVEYVIITTNALAPTWQVLADWKTRRGVPTVVRTVEWIQANYRQGCDLQETIRTFVKDAYAKWGVEYVLLAGDTTILPARYGFSTFGEPSDQSIPSDMYFACLDGNWNLNGDALWGQAAVNETDPGDSTDMYAEVYIGRVSTSSAAKASAYINKLMTFENPSQTDYQNKLLLLAEVLFPVNWDSTQVISMDGGSFSEEIAAMAPPCATLKKLYDNYHDYPGAQKLSKQGTIDQMNAGYGIVNHIGHGYRYNMSLGDLSLVNYDAENLTNTSKPFVLYFLNCTATAFDFPCLAEAFLESNGGAVSVLGASRAAYALPSRNYNQGFFRAIYQQSYTHVGQAFVQSRLAQTPLAWYDTADHYSHLLYNFLGDPEMVVHTCTLGTTALTHPSSIGLGLSNILVHVTVGGSPRSGALVCLQKGTEEYVFGTTDAGGDVTLPFRAESAGTVQLTVSGQNMTTRQETITAGNAGVAYVHTQSLTVDDDGAGGSSGNSDGVLDAGETAQLNVTFVNDGALAANSTSGVLRISSPWATVVDSTYSLGTVSGGGGTSTATGQVAFHVASNAPDGIVLPLTFRTTSGANTWTDVVNKVVHAPVMRLTLLKVDDYPPGGNGDGRIQAGETFDLLAYFKNYGTGAADGLQATLASTDPDVTIYTGSVSIGRANAMQEVTAATHFRLREAVIAANAMTLTITDGYARSQARVITLRGPFAPTPPSLDASTGANIVVATWTPSNDADLAGYNVYRALSGSGPWTRITVDRTARVAYFRDTGLAANTHYFYYVTAVDSSGNESVASTQANINTQPAQLSGWPIAMGAVSSCPLAVGDITGDGQKEIIAGNNHLYAWHWNGIELRDADSDPQTWGVFNTQIQTVTAAVALGQMDGRSGYEIFVTSWDDTNRAFVVKGDGTVMPGWPRNPDPGSSTLGYWGSPACMDVDGDGKCEVFAPAKNGKLYAWHANGTPLGSNEAFKSNLGDWSRCSPTFANLDSDPHPEIIYGAPNGTLYIWKADGTNFPNFPKALGTLCVSNTAIGDVNKDGIPDVVMITEGGAVNVINTKTGNQLPGWPQSISSVSSATSPSPALADFNGDGYLEIVVANNGNPTTTAAIRVYDYQGNVLSGWPKSVGDTTSESSPIVADISGDGVPDILFGNESGLLYGWDWHGVELPGFPLSIGDFIRSTPFADDVDGDGKINLVLAGWDKNVYVWNFTAPYVKSAAQWPTLKHDVQRTGNFSFTATTPTDVGGEPAASAVPRRVFLGQNSPNPFNPLTSIEYGVPALEGGARAAVRLEIFDVRGHRVRALLHGESGPGTFKAIWDGRDERGARLQSGVYFYRLQVAGEILTRRMVLLK